ncbi:MAG: cytochrome b/b6 domain-containing protein [Phycisphaerae bacterium]
MRQTLNGQSTMTAWESGGVIRRSFRATARGGATLCLGWFIACAPATAVGQEKSDCLKCHAEAGLKVERNGRDISLYVNADRLAASVHAELSCAACHESISMEDLQPDAPNPHGPGPHLVQCGECHEAEAELYQKHGRIAVGENPDIPACWQCHGSHDILPSNDRHSRVHPANLTTTCTYCHADVDLVKKHDVLKEAPITLYESSVHGRASRKGLYVAANCINCHSARDKDGKPTAHRILGPSDADSTINHFNVPDTCGQCHTSIAADYWEGIHGRLVKRGEVDAPVCTTCHGEHGIISPRDPRSPVSPAHVAERTCTPCHDSVVLNEKYGIPGDRLKSYIDSYHGLKSKAGDVHVANCASCHGAHRILPSTDPTSSIHPANLQETCEECHPGISTELARIGIHTTSAGNKAGWPEFFRRLYIFLIVLTIGLMLLHNAADWIRSVKQMNKKPFVLRLTINETMQHWILAVSFIVLVLSGFALRFSEAWWVGWLFGWGGGAGFLLRGTIHRVAAVVFMAVSFWHVLYLFTARGRTMLRQMWPNRGDLIHLKQNIQYFVGERDEKPRYGTFSYIEKAEYWALAWGTVIMIGTGLLLWFDNYFITRWHLPRTVLDVVLVIHLYEAWLATLAILVWHIYGVVFKPGVYPMNPAWLSGRMPRDLYIEEHPEGPRLKSRTYRVYYEEQEEPGSQDAMPSEQKESAPNIVSNRAETTPRRRVAGPPASKTPPAPRPEPELQKHS